MAELSWTHFLTVLVVLSRVVLVIVFGSQDSELFSKCSYFGLKLRLVVLIVLFLLKKSGLWYPASQVCRQCRDARNNLEQPVDVGSSIMSTYTLYGWAVLVWFAHQVDVVTQWTRMKHSSDLVPGPDGVLGDPCGVVVSARMLAYHGGDPSTIPSSLARIFGRWLDCCHSD